jgi:hypothetical protein
MTMLVEVDEMMVDDKEDLKFYFELSPPFTDDRLVLPRVFPRCASDWDSQNFSEEEDDTPRYASRREIYYFRSQIH